MKKNIIMIFLLLLAVIGGGVIIYFNFFEEENEINHIQDFEKAEPPKLKILDLESNSRPYAVMINNNSVAWKNHSGLQDAYIVYEIITEGGITRLMALYKDQTTTRIGSVRSSRHYFLDYALEHDAIYIHFGWSPQAQSDISTLKINNINGIYDSGFWRDTSLGVAYEHTAYTSIEKIDNVVAKKGYRVKTEQDVLLKYSIPEIGLLRVENVVAANTVEIPYSYSHKTSYKYDAESKMYLRFMNDIPHTDGITKMQYKTKNIIIQLVENDSIDAYGRQDIKNIGSGKGYYVTNGYAVPIIWEKKSRSEQTIYKHMNGNEVTVNDGNTFIQIMPINKEPTFLE